MSSELEKILKEIQEEGKRETLFTMTLERDRLFTALMDAGYVLPYSLLMELTMGPGATTTQYVYVPTGYVMIPRSYRYINSLPWYLTVYIWMDSDLPQPPALLQTRFPDRREGSFPGIWPLKRLVKVTCTNLHASETAYFQLAFSVALGRMDVWDMIKAVYLDTIVEYVRRRAEELTGIPAP